MGAAETRLGCCKRRKSFAAFPAAGEAALGLFAAFKLCLKILNPILNCSAGMGAHKTRICTAGDALTLSGTVALMCANSGKIFLVPWRRSRVSVLSEGRQVWDEHPELGLGWWAGAAC